MSQPPRRLNDLLADYFEDLNLAGITEFPPIPGSVQNGAGRRQSGENPLPSAPNAGIPSPAPASSASPSMKKFPDDQLEPILARVKPALSLRAKEAILRDMAQVVAGCKLCPDLVANRTQTVFGVGNPNAELVFVGEGPGADEDAQGIPFVGRSGQLLTDIIVKGMKMSRDEVYICNIVRCRPPGNRNPSDQEAACCRPFLEGTLRVISPQYICCLGAVAARNLLGTDLAIGRLRGKIHDYRGAKVVCTYHPAYLLRNPPAKVQTWEDIKMLLRQMGRM